MVRAMIVVVLCLTVWTTRAAAQDHQHAAESAVAAAPMTGLGSHHHRITTSNAQAQRLFDQGLVLLYGFNHGQAIRMFQRAAELDPKAPMPLWGIALAYGPNINDFEMDRDRAKTADEYVRKAQAVAANGTARERAYIDALSKRYSSDPNADLKQAQVAYKDAMAALAQQYPGDLDAQTLYAESLMDLRPWQLWTRDGKPADVTPEVMRVLESVLKRSPLHPGANHYYIHTMEGSPEPGKALASARRLQTLVPAAGHLVHMPAHIYARTGQFVASANSNAAAAAIDERFMQRTQTRRGMYPLMYYNHNVHFESYAASMAGQFARAKRTADKLTANVTPYIAEMPMIEAFVPQQVLRPAPVREMGSAAGVAGTAGAAAVDDHHLALRAGGGVRRENERGKSARGTAVVRPGSGDDTAGDAGRRVEYRRAVLCRRAAAARRENRGGCRRSGGGGGALSGCRRRRGSARVRRAADLVLSGPRNARCRSAGEREGGGSGADLPSRSEIQPAQRAIALRGVAKPPGTGQESGRGACPPRVPANLDGG